jgi:hypothetical protein
LRQNSSIGIINNGGDFKIFYILGVRKVRILGIFMSFSGYLVKARSFMWNTININI